MSESLWKQVDAVSDVEYVDPITGDPLPFDLDEIARVLRMAGEVVAGLRQGGDDGLPPPWIPMGRHAIIDADGSVATLLQRKLEGS
jgi:hypothetical protein